MRREEVAIGDADVIGRRRTTAASQHHLAGHELAVVFPQTARQLAKPRIETIGAARPLPDIAEHLSRGACVPASGDPAPMVASRRSCLPNRLDRRFDVTAPNVVWVTDITYIRTDLPRDFSSIVN